MGINGGTSGPFLEGSNKMDNNRMTNDQMQKSNETKQEQQCKNTRNKLFLSISLAVTEQLPEKCFAWQPEKSRNILVLIKVVYYNLSQQPDLVT